MVVSDSLRNLMLDQRVKVNESIATAANRSSIHKAFLLPNTSLALLLPAPSIRTQKMYVASTYAMYTTCAPMSMECNLHVQSGGVAQFHCLEQLVIQGEFEVSHGNIPLESLEILIFNDSGRTTPIPKCPGGCIGELNPLRHPLGVGITATLPFSIVGNQSDSQLVQLRVLDGVNSGDPYGILLWCNLSILAITYRIQPHRANPVQLLNHTPATPQDVFILSGPVLGGLHHSMAAKQPYISHLTTLQVLVPKSFIPQH
jgi:hypothetical protein